MSDTEPNGYTEDKKTIAFRLDDLHSRMVRLEVGIVGIIVAVGIQVFVAIVK